MRVPLRLLTCLVAPLLLAVGGRADTLTQVLAQNLAGVGNNGTIEDFGGVALFDPALGTLNSVTQTLQANFTFTPVGSGPHSYTFNVNGPETPIQSLVTGDTSQDLDYSVTTGPTLEELTGRFGQQYLIEPFDIATTGGALTFTSPVQGMETVVDTFTFNYTPSVAETPEPSSLALLATGLLGGVLVLALRRGAVRAA